ncbi:MAG TPA: hypothetical protein VLD37_02720 [Candidatus Bilamarchaeum sp.]|nr:hypothetical protein [Candidatus Bilamarchaeum sp.]
MAETFVGVEIAVIVVTASIVLAGLFIGLGRASGYKRLEVFGIEELVQSIINAAIIGSFAAIVELVGAVSASVVTSTCSAGSVITQLTCSLSLASDTSFSLFQEIVKILNIVGFYQGLSLDFGSFSIAPLSNLAAVSSILSAQLLALNGIIILIELNRQIATFIGQNALGLLFPVGLVMRTLFATRKIGGFLIGLAIGLYVFYPTFILIFPNPQNETNLTAQYAANFSNDSFYATLPVIDLNDNYAIAGKLDLLSGRCNPADYYNLTNSTNVSNTTSMCDDFFQSQYLLSNYSAITNTTYYTFTLQNETVDFSGDLTFVVNRISNTLAKSALYAVLAPLFSLIITIIFVKELANLLGSEIGLRTIASI